MKFKHVDDADSEKKMERARTVPEVLQDIGLGALNRAFQEQRVDNLETCQSLTDEELKTLGLHTIGDRVIFREGIREEINKSRVALSSGLTTRERGEDFQIPTKTKSLKTFILNLQQYGK